LKNGDFDVFQGLLERNEPRRRHEKDIMSQYHIGACELPLRKFFEPPRWKTRALESPHF
jgi:hypothetical protein